MPEIKQVISQLAAPSGSDPGRVTVGFYIREGDLLTMTDEAGAPVRDRMGNLVQHKLEPDQDEQSIARVLTRQIRRQRTGEDGSGFNRPLTYPRVGIA